MAHRETVAALREAARTEAARLIRFVAAPRGFNETIQACIAKAANRLGWNFSRAEDIWRCEARRIESFEMDALRRHRQIIRDLHSTNSENKESAPSSKARKRR